MSVFKYSKYKILIDPKSHKTQGLSVGDVVRRQYVDASGTIYSLMLVLETGVDMITSASGEQNQSHYFVGALLEGDEPANGQLLDFVRTTNLFNLERSGALYLTASDSASPYMDVIDGMSVDKSMCFPYMGGGSPSVADPTKYAIQGANYVTTAYSATKTDASRVFRATRNSVANTDNAFIGLKQSLSATLSNPQRVVVSYKIRGSKATSSIPVSFGYTSWGNMDGVDSTSVSTSWAYKVHIITIDYPAENPRSLYIDLRNILTKENDWCEIADLNIVLLSDIANFNNASKARVGKLSGIVDPVFGVMDGYGAYFQNLFATKNVNVSGTLTAGDENGSASTFYVGRIHKNSFINSLSPKFSTDKHDEDATAFNPAGVGKVFQLHTGTSIMSAQTREWLNSKIGRKYSLSFWMRSEDLAPISVSLAGRPAEEVTPTVSGEWEKIHVPTILTNPKDVALSLSITVNGASVLFTAPQLEVGGRVSLYQPTDDILRDTDEYGAWFNKGGIGGTIQNPLLKLNEDGSISSANGSFVINSDGSGYFANGAIKWGDKGVEFGEEVALAWREQTHKELNSLSIGASNLLTNSAFYNSVLPWSGGGTHSISLDTSNKFNGYNSLKCVSTASGMPIGASNRFFIQPKLSGRHTFSFYAKAASEVQLNVRIGGTDIVGVFTITPEWQRFVCDTAVTGESVVCFLTGAGTIWMSCPQLEYGDKATSYKLSDAEVNSRISSAQSTADSSVTALGGSSFPKLTKIDSTGVYTGTLTATQVNAVAINASSIKTGTLSADRIAANSINGDKIVAGSITASQINTSSLQSALITTSYIQGLSLNFTKGKIGGWQINGTSISKNNTYLTDQGSLWHSEGKWLIAGDGSGRLASGNISWDANGNVTFSDSVKLNWTSYADTAIQNIKVGGRNLFVDSERVRSVGGSGSTTNESILMTDLSALLVAGQQYTFSCETDGVWGASNGVDSVQAFICKDKSYTAGQYFALNNSPTTFTVAVGGTYWLRIDSNKGSVKHSFWNFKLEKGNKPSDWSPAPEDVESRIAVAQVGVNGITTALGGSSFPKLTKIDSTGVYTGTLTANQVNAVDINASSIKTGTLSADRIAAGSLNGNKITAGTISADRITAGSITSTQINVASLQASLVTADHIQGLTINFSKGKIGQWVISDGSMTNGTVRLASNGTIWHTGSKWQMGYDGAGYLASGNIKWDASGNVTFADSVKLNWTSYADTAIQNIKVGGRNFALNTSSDWTSEVTLSGISNQSVIGRTVKIDGWNIGDTVLVSFDYKYNNLTKLSGARVNMQGAGNVTQWNVGAFNSYIFTDKIIGSSGEVRLSYSFTVTTHHLQNTYFTVNYRHDYMTGTAQIRNLKVEIGSKQTAWSPAPEDVTSYTDSAANKVANITLGKIRYVKDWLNGSNVNTGNHWVEIMALDKNGTNVALNKTVSGSSQNPIIVSGDTSANNYAGTGTGLQHVIVDLGAVYDISAVKVWHYYSDSRAYNNTKTECSVDGVTWFTIFDSATEGTYKETSAGRTSYVGEYDRSTNKALDVKAIANSTITALGGSSYPKLTKIDSTGIYTGTLTAAQVNAVAINASSITTGTLSVDRLAAGSITADKVNVSSLQSSLITTSFIQGLSLSFTKGTIGGWTITSNAIRHVFSSNKFLIINNAEADSPAGSNRGHRGITMYNDDSAVATGAVKIVQIGALADKNTAETWSTETNYGFRIAIKGGTDIFRADSSGAQIAGWSFNSSSISKGNISLGADGTIKHASAWALNNDGSGRLAKGDISWDTSGNVTINANVKISGSAIAKAITTDSLQVGSKFSVAKDGTLTATNGIFSGTISGVSGTFRSLTAVNDSGGEEAEITFSSSGGLWFRGDMHHQGTYQDRSQRFYSADIWCRGTFGHSSKSVLIVYGAYGYVYTDSSSSGSRVSFSTVTSGVYSIPLYSPTEATAGLPIDMVLIKTTSSYTFTFPEYKYKTVDVMNIVDKNNNVYVYTNGKTHQMGGGVCLRMMNVGASNMNPTVSTSSYGAGWCIIGIYDNNW